MGEPTVAMSMANESPNGEVYYELDGDGDSSTTPCHPADPRNSKFASSSSIEAADPRIYNRDSTDSAAYFNREFNALPAISIELYILDIKCLSRACPLI